MSLLLEDLRPVAPAALFNALAQLPDSLTLVRQPYYRAAPDIVRQKRAHFDIQKTLFLKHLGEDHVDELRAMGLNDDAIASMRDHGTLPANRPGERMDSTVDHILSLHLGGSNDFDNLVLVPSRINQLKNDLEALQQTSAAQATIITIVPASAQVKVPYIPGGFQKAKLDHA